MMRVRGICALVVLCLGFAVADGTDGTVPTCKFSATIINSASSATPSSAMSFSDLKSHIELRFRGFNATIIPLEISFPCRALMPSHCCKTTASIRTDVSADLDALESVRTTPPCPQRFCMPTCPGVCAVGAQVGYHAPLHQPQVHLGPPPSMS